MAMIFISAIEVYQQSRYKALRHHDQILCQSTAHPSIMIRIKLKHDRIYFTNFSPSGGD